MFGNVFVVSKVISYQNLNVSNVKCQNLKKLNISSLLQEVQLTIFKWKKNSKDLGMKEDGNVQTQTVHLIVTFLAKKSVLNVKQQDQKMLNFLFLKRKKESIELGNVSVDLMVISNQKLNASNVKFQNLKMLNISLLLQDLQKSINGSVKLANLILISLQRLNASSAK